MNQTAVSDIVNKTIQEDIPSNKYLLYLLKLRGSQLFLLTGMKLFKKEKAGFAIWLWITGIGIGVGSFYLYFCYQLKGLGILFGLLFPHYFFYFYAYHLLQNIDYNGQKISGAPAKKGVRLIKRMTVVAVVIIGFLSECYVNPYFLKILKKIIHIKNYNI